MSLVAVVIEEDGWNALSLAEIADGAARAALAARGMDPDGFEIGLLACSDARIAALNREFRGKTGPTNVLSWPARAPVPAAAGARLPPPHPVLTEGRAPLGDVAIALQTCTREAKARSIPLKNHATHLILHGCLHLLGFDHETEADAAVMEGIETRALGGMDIENPHSRDSASFRPGSLGAGSRKRPHSQEARATADRRQR